jgi:1-acyl-sn-glycerol-3-phosphate acyltransferase
MRKISAFFRGLTVTLINLPVILCINALQMLTTPLFFLSRPHARALNERLAFLWSITFDFSLRKILRIPVTFTGDKPVPGENAFIIANHQCMADIPVIALLVHNAKMLRFIKWFVKDPIKYTPGVGWGMLFLDCVFLKRDWAKDRKTIENTFARLRHPWSRFWLISFPEGTRFTMKKNEKAKEYAKARGLPIPEHTLVPKPKGFSATMLGLGEKLGAVYDLTIRFSGPPPSFLGFFFCPQEPIEVLVKRYPLALIPKEETAQADWVKKRFQEKDQLLRRP